MEGKRGAGIPYLEVSIVNNSKEEVISGAEAYACLSQVKGMAKTERHSHHL